MTPMPPIGLYAPALANSWSMIFACALVRPPPPYSFGQVGVPQPRAPTASRHLVCVGVSLVGPSTPASALDWPLSSAGKLSARNCCTSARKAFSSVWVAGSICVAMGVFSKNRGKTDKNVGYGDENPSVSIVVRVGEEPIHPASASSESDRQGDCIQWCLRRTARGRPPFHHA